LTTTTTSIAEDLGRWAARLDPSAEDLALARRSLLDTVAATLAARDHPLRPVVAGLPDSARWSALGHVLDFDDLHLESTAHISVVCVPTALACRGGARAYLAGAGVMARLGTALGWGHYARGWHATCTSGAAGAAVTAGVALGLDGTQLAHAIALAVPASGGVQRAFGTPAKSLQVGFAAEAGVRAARLVAAGATADLRAVEQWLALVGGDPTALDLGGAAVPGGLAIKLFPCCYAMQRPIAAARELLAGGLTPAGVARLVVRTPEATLHPLIHHRPQTGLEGKFSLEYAVAATLLDGYPGFTSFSDDAVRRPEAQDLLRRVTVETTPDGEGLLTGTLALTAIGTDGAHRTATVDLPPGSPLRPPTDGQLAEKAAACGCDLRELTWAAAAELLAEHYPASGPAGVS
jgi:2-methylcitrate dehydratase PrpD